LRQRAARALGTVNNQAARQELIEFLPQAPARLAVEIAAALANSPEGSEALLTNIETGKASALLLQEPNVADRLKQQQAKSLHDRIAKLTANLPTRDQQVRVLIENRLTGYFNAKKDISKGKQVFVKSCANCHKIDGEGPKIGPELDGIGIRGPERLLEDVLDPSRNVDQLFRTTMLVADGRPLSGLLKSENDNALVLIDSQGKDISINVDEIEPETRRISHLSPMPANVQDLVPEEDFYHLMEFLLSHKPKPTGSEGK
jgi:putative heme-binding domain-containing protein